MHRLAWRAALALVVATPAWSQGKLGASTMKDFGGTYMVDCASNASPKATVFPDALVFLHGDKRIAGSRPVQTATFFGANPPPEHRTVLTSETPGGQLIFMIFQDKAGTYLKLDGEQKVMAAIGKPVSHQKFRRCDGRAPQQMQAAAPAPAATPATASGKAGTNTAKTFKGYALHELSAAGLLYDANAKATYYRALGPLAKEPWLARLDGPSPQNRPVRVAGADYVLLAACKNHDCEQNSVVLLWSGVQDVVYGKVFQRGRSTLIGSPPPAVVAELENVWRKEWRPGR